MKLSYISTPDSLSFLIEQSLGSIPSIDRGMTSTYKQPAIQTVRDPSSQPQPKKSYTSAKEMHDNAPRTSTEAQSQQQIDDDFLAKKDIRLWKGLVDDAKGIASYIQSMQGPNQLPIAANVIKSMLTLSAPPGKSWRMTLKEGAGNVSITEFTDKLKATKISPYTLGVALHAFIKGIIKSAGLSVRQVVSYINRAYGNKNASQRQPQQSTQQPQTTKAAY